MTYTAGEELIKRLKINGENEEGEVNGTIDGWVLPDDTSDWCVCKVLNQSTEALIKDTVSNIERQYNVRIQWETGEKGSKHFKIKAR